MPVRTRSASGRFEPAKVRNTPYNDPDVNFYIPRSWLFKVSFILILFILTMVLLDEEAIIHFNNS
jgi:hypothetical protein